MNRKVKKLVYLMFVILLVVLIVMGGYYLLFIKNPSSGDLKVKLLNFISSVGVNPHKVSFLQLNSNDMSDTPMKFISYIEDQSRNYSYSLEAVVSSEPLSIVDNMEYQVNARSQLGQEIKLKIMDGITNIIWDKKLWEDRSGTVLESMLKSEDTDDKFICDEEYCNPNKSAKYLKKGDRVTINYYSEVEPKEAIKGNVYLTDTILSKVVTTITVNTVDL